jgi:hypothetical protein
LPICLAGQQFERWKFGRRASFRYAGIALVDDRIDKRDNDFAFVAATVEALRLIERVDPRRFRQVRRYLQCIVNRELLSGGQYNHRHHACFVDFARYQLGPGEPYREWRLAQYAALIVHEATHGRLDTAYFPYSRNTRAQAERICVAEERRFVARLRSEEYDLSECVLPFDAERWEPSWTRGKRESFRLLLKRVRTGP